MVSCDPLDAPPGATPEAERLAALLALKILDTPPEREFDLIAQTAQRALGCRIALISLVDAERQWFKAKCGLAAEGTPRQHAFCAHAVAADALLVVPDATADARFVDNPLVTGAPHIRFYAGVPIHAAVARGDRTRQPIGTLCVIDDTPRRPDAGALATLRDLAGLAEALLDARASALIAATRAEERRLALASLDRSHRILRQAERMANIGSWRLSLADDQVEWSDQIYAIHGLPLGTATSLHGALDFYPPHARALVTDAIAQTLATGAPFDIETDFVTAQGEYRRVHSIGEVELDDGLPVALIGVFQDITSRHALEQALRRTAYTDDLTRIASRARFNQLLDDAIGAATLRGEPLALLLIDLDRFKQVNDRCGHLAGDDLLLLMASRLQAPYLAGSVAARLGGDEFALLVTCRQALADLPALIGRLLADLREPVSDGTATIDVSATIGGCWLGGEARTRRDLLRGADAALYRAKRAQRGSAVIAGADAMIVATVARGAGDRRTALRKRASG